MRTTVRKSLLSASIAALLTVAVLPGAAATDEVVINPTLNIRPDPEAPSESTGYGQADATVDVGSARADGDTTVLVGEYRSCAGFFCTTKDGHKATTYQHAEAGGETLTLDGTVTLDENEDEPAGYEVGTLEASCTHNGDAC